MKNLHQQFMEQISKMPLILSLTVHLDFRMSEQELNHFGLPIGRRQH